MQRGERWRASEECILMKEMWEMGRDVLREDPYPDNNHQHTTTTTYIVNGGRPAPLCQHYVSAQSGKMWHLEEKSTGRPIVTICFTELIFEFDEDFGCGRIQCP